MSLLNNYIFLRGGSKKFRGGGTSVLREGVRVIDGRGSVPPKGGLGACSTRNFLDLYPLRLLLV